MADVTEEYKLQVRQACNRGFSFGWMALAKKLNILDDSPLRKADAIPLPFPLPPPSSQPGGESESESEDADKEEDEALVRKPKDAAGAKSPPQNEQVLDLTQDEEGDEVIPEAVPDTVPADIPSEVKTVEQTLQEIDAEIAAEKEAEVVSDLQIQQSGGEDP